MPLTDCSRCFYQTFVEIVSGIGSFIRRIEIDSRKRRVIRVFLETAKRRSANRRSKITES